MPNIVGTIPEFTEAGTATTADQNEGTGSEQVKQTTPDEGVVEKETPSEPAAGSDQTGQQPSGQKTGEDTGIFTKADVEDLLIKATQGLRNEISGLRTKINSSTGTDRQLAQEKLVVAEQKLDDLSDVDPNDVALIEKVLRSKGYVRQEDVSKMSYEQVKNEQINGFLEKFPEYKPENDPDDVHWGRLQNELKSGFYKLPTDPKKIGALLEKIHRDTSRTTSDVSVPVKKRQVETASLGAGGTQKSSSTKQFDPAVRLMLENGGWSKDDIDKMEMKLT